MSDSVTLAHLSDVHLSPVTGFTFRYWNAKRSLGFLNWQRGRRSVHQREIASRLMADAIAQNVDHIAITGDLINIGLPAEYDAALSWLQSHGDTDRITVVPGNHDIYTRLTGHDGFRIWAGYMAADAETLTFPFVRRVGPVALVGLNSAIETRPGYNVGELGARQRDSARDVLEKLKDDGLLRVVLIHHPPLPGLAGPRRDLLDARQFAAILQKAGAELVLHGHNHLEMTNWAQSVGNGRIPVIGVPSASAAIADRGRPLARYNTYTFFRTGTGLRIRMVVRGIETANGPVVHLSERMLDSDQSSLARAAGA